MHWCNMVVYLNLMCPPSKLVSFGANGVIMFQGAKTRVIKQLKDKTCSYLVMSSLYSPQNKPCCTNLVLVIPNIQNWSFATICLYLLFTKLETLFGNMQFGRLFQHKTQKILTNVNTQWILMLSSSNWMVSKYRSLVVGMFEKQVTSCHAKVNLEFLLDIEFFLGLTCTLLLLEYVWNIYNFAQS